MENRNKPPVDINEIVKQPDVTSAETRKPGGLDYAGGGGKKSGKQASSSGMNWGQILMSAILAVALSTLIFFQLTPPNLTDELAMANAEITTLKTEKAALATELQTERSRIDNIVNSMGDYAKRTELGSYASQSDLDSLSGLPDTIDDKLAELEAEIDAKIAELEEAAGSSGASGELSDEVYIDFRMNPKLATLIDNGDGTWSTSIPILMEVVNDTAYDIQEVEIEMSLILYSQSSCLSTIVVDSVTSMPPDFEWYHDSYANGIGVYGLASSLGNGLEVGAGDDENVSVTLNITVDCDDIMIYSWEAEVTDYTVN